MRVRVAPPGGYWHTVSGSYSERLHGTDSFSPWLLAQPSPGNDRFTPNDSWVSPLKFLSDS